MTQEQTNTLNSIINALNAVMIDETFSARFAMQCRKFKRVVTNVLNGTESNTETATGADGQTDIFDAIAKAENTDN